MHMDECRDGLHYDPTLCHLFLMNNCLYIVQTTKNSELETILGGVMIQKHTTKVRQHHESYRRSSWNKVLDFLKLDNNVPMQPNEVAKSMKNNLKSFNMVFGEICSVQSAWFVFDELLRKK